MRFKLSVQESRAEVVGHTERIIGIGKIICTISTNKN